jgi:hypothetical protein
MKCSEPIRASSKAELEALDVALVEIARTYAPITVRGAFYRAVARGLVPQRRNQGLQGRAAAALKAQGVGRNTLRMDR